MIPGLIILLIDHHNRVEEEIFMKQMKLNPNLSIDANGNPIAPQAQSVGIMDLFRHEHHADHDHGEHDEDSKP